MNDNDNQMMRAAETADTAKFLAHVAHRTGDHKIVAFIRDFIRDKLPDRNVLTLYDCEIDKLKDVPVKNPKPLKESYFELVTDAKARYPHLKLPLKLVE